MRGDGLRSVSTRPMDPCIIWEWIRMPGVWHGLPPFWNPTTIPVLEADMSWTVVDDIQVVFCTAPDKDVAANLGKDLVEHGLAACVNIIPSIRSIYRWNGQLCDEAEVLMVIKTCSSKADKLAQAIKAGHPYENPEVIALPVAAGLQAYLQWVRAGTADV